MADLDLDRSQALAFRAVGHGLAIRRPRVQLVDAVRVVGLRRTRNAALSVAARVEAIAPDDVVGALDEERLVAFYGGRGTVMMAPAAEMPVLTIGTAPNG